jgi:Tfp pilus assembly protein PilX
MYMATNLHSQPKQGFALLMTLIVVSVLISIGLAVVDLSLKQVRLSTNAKDSESAFHAANAGVECGRYWRRIASSTMETGGAITPTCFSASTYANTKSNLFSSTNGDVYLYNYSFSWGTSPSQRCTSISTLVMSATVTGAGLTYNVASQIPGYPLASKTCAAGERCTVVASHGFNMPCASATGYGSVEREVLLQF